MLPHVDCFKTNSWQDAHDSLLLESYAHFLIGQDLIFSSLKTEKKAEGSNAVRRIISKGSKEQRAYLQIFSIQTNKQRFLLSCVCALVHICAFKYRTSPTSV